MAARRRLRILNIGLYTMLVGIILGLVGWINQAYIADEWHWYTVTRPYAYAQVWPHVLTAAQEQALRPGNSFKECAQDCAEMVVVPAGSFTMGSPITEKSHGDDEAPQHVVKIGKPFAVAKDEVTYADWEACVKGGGCNSYIPNDYGLADAKKVPVLNVHWDDAKAYVAWLSLVTGKAYRLLTEAEYEYATRAGTTTAYPWGNAVGTDNADCKGCGSQWDDERPAPVGSFPANRFGLYDMVGNAWEWIEDCGHSDYYGAPVDGSAWLEANRGDCGKRVSRGGSWSAAPDDLRSARRIPIATSFRAAGLGFRVARTLNAP